MQTPAGRIRTEGYTFHGIRASSVVSLREVGCGDRDIESITGMSSEMVTRYSRFAISAGWRSQANDHRPCASARTAASRRAKMKPQTASTFSFHSGSGYGSSGSSLSVNRMVL
jgi:hypothetical protein